MQSRRDGVPAVAAGRGSPVVVLSCGYSGGRQLQQALSAEGGFTCTSGTGILPLCATAAETWREVDGGAGRAMSPLAISSVRALATALITARLAGGDGRRWCEFSTLRASSAEAFVQVLRDAKLICVYRACADVIFAGIQANPWGLAGQGLEAFLAAYPGNSVAALAAYWAAYTEPLLAFESAHADACIRVRYEDLVTNRDKTLGDILEFIGTARESNPQPGLLATPAAVTATAGDVPGCGAGVPAGQIPGPLLKRVNDLLARLGYAALEVTSGGPAWS